MATELKSKIEDRYVTVDGLRLRYIEEGQGPAAILLHGASLGSSADVFIRNLGPLAKAGIIRAAGFANGQNPISVVLPCHRVIGSDGSLTGYGGGLARKGTGQALAKGGSVKGCGCAQRGNKKPSYK